jgi:hypothetical protein
MLYTFSCASRLASIPILRDTMHFQAARASSHDWISHETRNEETSQDGHAGFWMLVENPGHEASCGYSLPVAFKLMFLLEATW